PLDHAQKSALARAAAPLDLARLTLAGAPLLQRRVPQVIFDRIAVDLPPVAFLQPSAEGEATLRAAVSEGVIGARKILDLFSGLGTFALPLARKAAVHAVDSEQGLLEPMLAAARREKGLKPFTIEARDLMRSPLPPDQLAKFDAVVFDPPRTGAKLQA